MLRIIKVNAQKIRTEYTLNSLTCKLEEKTKNKYLKYSKHANMKKKTKI
jgi:hypothetical protein